MKKRLLIATAGFAMIAALPILQASSNVTSTNELSVIGLFKGSPIVAKAAARFGGAIYSLTWRGREFINSTDHGRELQSASSFDGMGNLSDGARETTAKAS